MPESKSSSILITGAKGNIGRELTRELSAQNRHLRAMVRSNKGADAIAEREGAEVVAGDFNEPKSIADALKGMDRAFLLTSSSEQAQAQQSAFVDSAKSAGGETHSQVIVMGS